jgi:hypothetical protein
MKSGAAGRAAALVCRRPRPYLAYYALGEGRCPVEKESRMPMAEGLRRFGRSVSLVLILVGFGCTQMPQGGAAQTAGPPPPGTARIWIYRVYDPSITLATPEVRLNGQAIGVAQLSGAFYKDVPPGVYYVTVDSRGVDVNQFAQVALAAGQTVYVKVDAEQSLGAACRDCKVDAFTTRVMPPQLAQIELNEPRGFSGP